MSDISTNALLIGPAIHPPIDSKRLEEATKQVLGTVEWFNKTIKSFEDAFQGIQKIFDFLKNIPGLRKIPETIEKVAEKLGFGTKGELNNLKDIKLSIDCSDLRSSVQHCLNRASFKIKCECTGSSGSSSGSGNKSGDYWNYANLALAIPGLIGGSVSTIAGLIVTALVGGAALTRVQEWSDSFKTGIPFMDNARESTKDITKLGQSYMYASPLGPGMAGFQLFGTTLDNILVKGQSPVEGFKNALQSVINAISPLLTPLKALTPVFTSVSNTFNNLKNDVGDFINTIKGPLDEAWNALTPALSELKGAFGDVYNEISGAFGDVWNTLGEVGRELSSAFNELLGPVNEITAPLTNTGKEVGDTKPKISLLKQAAMWLADRIKEAIPYVKIFAGFIRDVAHKIRDFAQWIKDARAKVEEFRKWMSDLGERIKKFKFPTLTDIIKWIKDKLPQNLKFPTLGDIIGWIKSKMPSWLRFPTWGDIKGWIQSHMPSWLRFPSWGDIKSWIQNHMPSWLHFPSWNDIAYWIKRRIGLGGPGLAGSGTISSAISAAQSVTQHVVGAAQTVWNWGSSTYHHIFGGPRVGGVMSKAAGSNKANALDNFFSNFTYQAYEGSQKSIAQTIKDMSGNCVDGTLAQLWMAGQLGIPAGAEFTTWLGHPHMLGIVEGAPRDVANHALTGSWSHPPAGPGGSNNAVKVINLHIEGDVYGLPDFEEKVKGVAGKYIDREIGFANQY